LFRLILELIEIFTVVLLAESAIIIIGVEATAYVVTTLQLKLKIEDANTVLISRIRSIVRNRLGSAKLL